MTKKLFVVFDLDGTLSDASHRAHHLEKEPKDWDAWHAECGQDRCRFYLMETLRALVAAGHDVEVWTGRSEAVAATTISWFWENYSHTNRPFLRMRPIGDHRPDTELKKEWAETYGWPDLVFEDRKRMVDMWRSHGVPCCQVAEGDF